MSINAATASFLDQFNFTGGYPSTSDLAPSILFTILYVFAGAVMVFRLIRPEDRSFALIRPTIFIVVRIATFILRAVMSKNNYGESELIAELVFVSIGFLFLISPIIDLWKKHVESGVPKDQQPGWARRLATAAQLVLIAAIATAVAGSALISSSSSSGNTTTVTALRKASYVLSLGVVGVTLIAVVLTHTRFGLNTRGTLTLIVPLLLLIIVAVYRVVQIFTTDASAPVRSKAAFWVLQVTCEFLALVCLLAVSLPTTFPGNGAKIQDRRESEQSMAEQGLRATR